HDPVRARHRRGRRPAHLAPVAAFEAHRTGTAHWSQPVPRHPAGHRRSRPLAPSDRRIHGGLFIGPGDGLPSLASSTSPSPALPNEEEHRPVLSRIRHDATTAPRAPWSPTGVTIMIVNVLLVAVSILAGDRLAAIAALVVL